MDSSSPLAGKVALVTGSTTELGLAIAQELGRRGAKVALNYARSHDRPPSPHPHHQRRAHHPDPPLTRDQAPTALQ
ncbi:MAG: hypothetical protein ACKVI3_17655 [Verrucomicrobiia bacterium]